MTASMLALATDAFGGRGGIAQYNRDFLSALADAGCRVVAIPRHAPDTVTTPEGVRAAGRQVRADRLFPGGLRRGLRRPAPNRILRPSLYGAAWLAGRKGRRRPTGHADACVEAWRRPSALVRWACERASLILNVSRFTRARVLDWAAIPPERAVVLPNTVAECFTPGDGAALRREWSLEGKKVLLTVGRMDSRERYKGHDRVIAALPELIAAGHDVVYVVAGEGDDHARLASVAEEAGVGRTRTLRRRARARAPGLGLPDGRSLRHAVHGRGVRHRIPRGDGVRHSGAWFRRGWRTRCASRWGGWPQHGVGR